MKILMVCLGNICRSPLAEGILQHKANLAGLNWMVDSAGTANYHVGEAPHRLSQKVAKQNGIDISHLRGRQFSKNDMLEFDKIYVMDTDNYDDVKRMSKELFDAGKTYLLLNELYPGKNMGVPDPWYGTEEGYHKVFAILNDACDKIISNASPSPSVGGDEEKAVKKNIR
jgi:protein-tyrosine phosphatase